MTDSQALWPALAGLVIFALIRALKSPKVPAPLDRIPTEARPFLALALGVLSGALDAWVRGTPWRQALTAGLVSAAGAIVGHDTIVEGLRRGRELGAPKPVPDELPDTLRTGRGPDGGES